MRAGKGPKRAVRFSSMRHARREEGGVRGCEIPCLRDRWNFLRGDVDVAAHDPVVVLLLLVVEVESGNEASGAANVARESMWWRTVMSALRCLRRGWAT